jgi:hypothetical protein
VAELNHMQKTILQLELAFTKMKQEYEILASCINSWPFFVDMKKKLLD